MDAIQPILGYHPEPANISLLLKYSYQPQEVQKNMKIFIGSSTQSLPYANSVKVHLTAKYGNQLDVLIWNTAFSAGEITINRLLDLTEETDLGLFIFAPDDQLLLNEKEEYSCTRDNVILEAGFFIGRMGLERTLILAPIPEQGKRHRMPTDLSGVTIIQYCHGADEYETYANMVHGTYWYLDREIDRWIALLNNYHGINENSESILEIKNTQVITKETLSPIGTTNRFNWLRK